MGFDPVGVFFTLVAQRVLPRHWSTVRLLAAFMLFIPCVVSGQVLIERGVPEESSHQVADVPSTYFGPFKINGEKPKGFESFDFFILGYKNESDADKDNREALVPDKDGNVAVRGELVTVRGTALAFAMVKLVEIGPVTVYYKGTQLTRIARSKPVRLSFTTTEVKGFKYEFSGEYLDSPDEEGSGYTSLRGVFKKFKDGKVEAEATIGFKQLAYQELIEPPPN